MVSQQAIRAFVDRVVAEFHPERVILFGSYARGCATEDSDVDLLVVMDCATHPAVRAAEIRRRVRAGFPMDLIVRSAESLRRRLAMGDPFAKEILDQGRVIHESEHAGVG